MTTRDPARGKMAQPRGTGSARNAWNPVLAEQPSPQSVIQRAQDNSHALMPADVVALQRMVGNAAVQRILAGRSQSRTPGTAARPPLLQTKLKVGPANDRYEQEADRTAEQVLRFLPSAPQTKMTAQRAAGPMVGAGGGVIGRKLENRIRGAGSAGRPVPDPVRLAVEKATGADYSSVRVHDDRNAHAINDALGARASTHGRDIFLAHSQSPHNVQLMAHELTHTVQQGAIKPTHRTTPMKAQQGTPTIQRTDDEKKIKKKMRSAKAKGGLAKAGQVGLTALDWLTTAPLRVIDQLSVADLHAKDFANFARTGKTRKQRERPVSGVQSTKYSRGNTLRTHGRTGLRAYLSGVKYHQAMYGSPAKDMSLPWMGIANPFVAMGKGTQAAHKAAKGYDDKVSGLRAQKNDLRQQKMADMTADDMEENPIFDENDLAGDMPSLEDDGSFA